MGRVHPATGLALRLLAAFRIVAGGVLVGDEVMRRRGGGAARS